MAELTGKPISELPSLSYVPNASLFACTNGESASRSVDFLTLRDSVLRRGTLIGDTDDLNNYTNAGFYYLSWTAGTTAVQNWPYDNYGGLLLVFIGNNSAYRVQIAIISGSDNCPVFIRRYTGSAWSAWKTAFRDGDELSSDLKIKEATSANLRLQNTAVTVGDTSKAGTIGNLAFWDSSGSAKGLVYAQYTADDNTDLTLYARDENNNTNQLRLRVDADGNPVVIVSNAAAWRAAIGNDRATVTPTVVSSIPSGFTSVTIVGAERSGYVVSITATVVVASTPASSWTPLISDLPSPSHYIYQTVPTNADEFGRGLNLRLTSGGVLQFARGVAGATYNFTLTYIAT